MQCDENEKKIVKKIIIIDGHSIIIYNHDNECN